MVHRTTNEKPQGIGAEGTYERKIQGTAFDHDERGRWVSQGLAVLLSSQDTKGARSTVAGCAAFH